MNLAPGPVGILIIAAGCGRRFTAAGGKGDKLQSDVAGPDGKVASVFSHAFRAACEAEMPVVVVTRPAQQAIRQRCAAAGVPVVLVENSAMGESIAAGVRATSDWRGWIIHLADMPFIAPSLFNALARALEDNPAVRPVYQGVTGHPVGFGRSAQQALSELHAEEGARSVLRSLPLTKLNWPDDTILRDIDTPAHLIRRT